MLPPRRRARQVARVTPWPSALLCYPVRMADLALEPFTGTARTGITRWDFMVRNGDVVKTNDERAQLFPPPPLLRQLLQGEWIGDDGEREGDSLQDVRFIDQDTERRVQEIIERRGAVLVRKGLLESVTLDRVAAENDQVYAFISYTLPGQDPQSAQLPLLR